MSNTAPQQNSCQQIFEYEEAFSRNIGWVTAAEQQILKSKKIAIAGMGGVGGNHLANLSRLGISNFHIADFDMFEIANFNRQYGADMTSVGYPKVNIMDQKVRNINPEANVKVFENGVTDKNLMEFIDGIDLFIDSIDFFELEIRRKIFAECYKRGIPAITAAPLGMGTAVLCFLPGKMSFDQYFDFKNGDENKEENLRKFVVGLAPRLLQKASLIEPGSVNFDERKVPSTPMGIDLATGVACTTALKLLLARGAVMAVPRGIHFDAYRSKLVKTWRPGGNKNPIQKILIWYAGWYMRNSRSKQNK